MKTADAPDLELFRSGYASKALEPAIDAFRCHCGKPRCVFRPGYLVAFRTHIANLHHVIADAQYGGAFAVAQARGWSAVTYQLKMAASMEGIVADTGFVDFSGSSMMCRPAAEYEDRHSRLASRYAAALIIFNFLWSAYEAAIKVGAASFRPNDTTAFRGRELMKVNDQLGVSLKCLRRLTRHAVWAVLHPGDLEKDRAKVTALPNGSAAQAAELARIFRNHIAHGSDEPPQPDQLHVSCRAVRFFSVSRLLLLLIQITAIQAIDRPDAIYEAWNGSEGRRPRFLAAMLAKLQFESCSIIT